MNPDRTRTTFGANPRLGWLIAAAAGGAVAAFAVLRVSTPAPAVSDTGTRAQPSTAVSATLPTSPAPSATTSTATATADAARSDETATDDASLIRRARDEFGYDCDSIASRSATRNGTFEITCANGVVLRVHALEGAPTRFAPVH